MYEGIEFKTEIKSLGIYFGTNKKVCMNLNWESKKVSIQFQSEGKED